MTLDGGPGTPGTPSASGTSGEVVPVVRDRLTGVAAGSGVCADCARELRVRVFEVQAPDSARRVLGRRCAARATGWAAGRLEREVERAARLVVLEGRRVVVADLFPVLAGAVYPQALWDVLSTAVGEDRWWDGRGPAHDGMYPDWQSYVQAMLTQRAST